MMYRVIKAFTDMQDDNYPYNIGDEYPRKGVKVLASRYKELASSKNRRGEPLIEEIEDEKPKKTKEDKTEE